MFTHELYENARRQDRQNTYHQEADQSRLAALAQAPTVAPKPRWLLTLASLLISTGTALQR